MSIFDILKKREEEHVASELTDAIKALKKNEIVMIPKVGKRLAKASESKIGGEPYLPADFVWPTYTDSENVTRPLSFFCQINLSDVKKYDKDGLLPERGMLYFFYECESFSWGYDPEDRGAAQVFYVDTTDALGCAPTEIPEDIDEGYVIPEIPLEFKARATYPSFEEFDALSGFDIDFEEYYRALRALGIDKDEDSDEDIEEHKLLGYADVIQDEMLTECERTHRGFYSGDPESYRDTPEDEEADIAEHAKDWMLLLQISSIETDDFEFMFGDCGMLYFYIKREDLAAMRFDRIEFSVQCY